MSIAIWWRWNCYNIQIYLRLQHYIQTNFDFTHTLFEVVLASITLQHNTLHFFCLYRPPTNRQNNLTDSMSTEQLPDLDYVNNLPGFVCLVGDMNIHFDNPLQSLTKQTLTNVSLHYKVQIINKPTTHWCHHIIDWVIVRSDDIHKKYTATDSLESENIALNPTSMFQSLSLLPYTGLLETLLTLTAHHLLLNFPVFQSFHLLERQASSVIFCALY